MPELASLGSLSSETFITKMTVLSRNSSSVLTRRALSTEVDEEPVLSLKMESKSKDAPKPVHGKPVWHRYVLIFLLVFIAVAIALLLRKKEKPMGIMERSCQPLLSAARRAYSGQIDYVRRGLTTATASCFFTEFR